MKTVSDIRNTLEGIKSRLDEAEDQISGLEDKVEKNIQSKLKKKELKRRRTV